MEWLLFPPCLSLRPSLRRVYLQSECRRWLPGHVRRPFSTMVIDLREPLEAIRGRYDALARYQVRRAGKDGLRVWYDQDVADVIELFSLTARARGLSRIDAATFATKPEYVVAHAAAPGAGTVAAHFYLLDRPGRRVWLGYNCSAYRKFRDPVRRSLCGRANRYLFDRDFAYFREQGFHTYDFGGYEPAAADPAVRSVNEFKETLGGQLRRQYNYYPLWYAGYRFLRRQLTRR